MTFLKDVYPGPRFDPLMDFVETTEPHLYLQMWRSTSELPSNRPDVYDPVVILPWVGSTRWLEEYIRIELALLFCLIPQAPQTHQLSQHKQLSRYGCFATFICTSCSFQLHLSSVTRNTRV
jgi:hypothetical protein